MFKKYLKYALLGFTGVILSSCSNDEPKVDPVIPDIDNDLLGGKIFYYIDLSNIEDGDYMLETSEPVDFYLYDNDNTINIKVLDSDYGQYLTANIQDGFSGERMVIPGYAVGRETGKTRNVIFIVTGDIDDESIDGFKWSDESKVHTAISNVLGKGTYCYGELGNGNVNILLYDHLPIKNQELFYFSTDINNQTLDEIKATSFNSLTEQWGFNVGVSGQYKGFKGGFDFGMKGFKKESNDYEYYMCYYKVEKAEMKLHTLELARMAQRVEDAPSLLGFFAKGFREAILHDCNDKFNPEDFYKEWGTDIIVQGTLGGYYNMVFTREENMYENSIGFDLSLYAAYTKEKEETDPFVKWFDKILGKSKDPDITAKADVSYNKDKYFKSSKAEKKTSSKGGNRNIDNPDQWIEAFNDEKDADKWNLIQYKTTGDVISKDGEWFLFPIEDMAEIVVDATETILKFSNSISKEDKDIIENARENIIKLRNARNQFIESQLLHDSDKTPLVIADVMMVNNPDRRMPGQPKPFLAPDPRDGSKERMYYPMICNDNFAIKKASKGMRGKPIDTNDAVFITSRHTSSHYWYYALAHQSDCTPIVDIRFLTEKEAHDNSNYRFYYKRGDHARHGLSGLLAKERYVYVKYQDMGYDSNIQYPITAFGLYDDHSDYKNLELQDHIIASTIGTELPKTYTPSEYGEFRAFWNNEYSIVRNNHFYEGGGDIPHPLKLIYSTKPLGFSSLSNLKPNPETWGSDNFSWEIDD